MKAAQKYLITIVGPTAIGKTSLSIKLANHFNCEIISADSRQFFKEMSIGTAAPTSEELLAAPHHLVHHKSIFDSYNVGDFEKETLAVLDDLFQKNDFAVLAGGSGLYVDAVLNGMDEFPEIAENVRESIRQKYENHGIGYLQKLLRETDPEYFSFLEAENPQTLQNPQRLMRFTEVGVGSGKPYSSFLSKRNNNRNFVPILIGLEAERGIIYDRINQRVDLMMENGLLDEAQNLYLHKELNALQTVGYRELFDYFEGKSTLDFAVSEIKKNTRRFSKRQMTWFKRNGNTRWFDYSEIPENIISYIEKLTEKE